MKILLGADQYPEHVNGAATFTGRLALALVEAGHDVDLAWPSADGHHRRYLEAGVRVHRVSSVTLPGRHRMQVSPALVVARQVQQILQIAQPDVVHVQSHLGLGRSLLRAARRSGLPVLATNHFMPENIVPQVPVVRRFPVLASWLAWRDVERVFSDAHLISAPTQRAVDLLARSTNLPRAEAISCGIDLHRFQTPATPHSRHTAPVTGPTALFVGRLEPEKHVDELLAAFARVPERLGARLDIVGTGSLRRRLEAQVGDLGLTAAVTFAGGLSDDDVLDRYRRADLFVMPGTAELQSLATLEAMAVGLPVVAADAMALPHLVHDGRNGLLYQPGDVEGLAAGLTRLLADPLLRRALGLASREMAEAHALSSTVSLFEQRYRALIAARPSTVVGTGADLALAS